MAATSYGKKYLADFAFKGVNTVKPLYASLHTSRPTPVTSLELTGNGYRRVETSPATWTIETDGDIVNAAQVRYPSPTAAWSAPTHFGIYDALVGGNLMFYSDNAFNPAVGAPNTGHVVSFDPGQLNLDWS